MRDLATAEDSASSSFTSPFTIYIYIHAQVSGLVVSSDVWREVGPVCNVRMNVSRVVLG